MLRLSANQINTGSVSSYIGDRNTGEIATAPDRADLTAPAVGYGLAVFAVVDALHRGKAGESDGGVEYCGSVGLFGSAGEGV